MNMWQIVSGGHKNLHGRVKGLMILKLQEKRACSVSHPSSLAPAPRPNGPATSPSSEESHAKHSLPPSLSLLFFRLLLFSPFGCGKALFFFLCADSLLFFCDTLITYISRSLQVWASVLYHLNPPCGPLNCYPLQHPHFAIGFFLHVLTLWPVVTNCNQ